LLDPSDFALYRCKKFDRVNPMKITLIILSAALALLVLYFFFNMFSPKQNTLNKAIKLTKRRHASVYFLFGLMLLPVVAYAIKHEEDRLIAQAHGFDTYAAFEIEVQKAKNVGLSISEYQQSMRAAKKAGFSDYTSYQQHLEAKAHNYDSYEAYIADVKQAEQYNLTLTIYRKAKAESDAKNFEHFDEYLLHVEKASLTKKLQRVSKLEGDYNIDTVPLGVKKNELLSLVDDCKIDQIPDYSFPISNTLAPRSDAHVSHFFPQTETNSNFGLTSYNMNFSVMPGLDRQAITKHEMKCENSRYDLWFLKSDNSLVMYEKTIHMPNIRQYDKTVSRIEGILNAKCDSDISVGLETSFEQYGTRQVKNLYCKSFQEYIIATIVDGSVIAGVRQDPDIHIGYLSDRLWKQYINNLHAVKGKKRDVSFTQNRTPNRNQTQTIENR